MTNGRNQRIDMGMGKLPPQAVDLEESVIGILLSNSNMVSIAIEILQPEHFYRETHQIIFQAINNLFRNNDPVDIITVTSALRQMGKLEAIGGSYHLTELEGRGGNPVSIEYNCRIIQECFFKREVIRVCSEAISDAYDDTSDTFEVVEKVYTVYDIISSETGKSFESMADILPERMKAYEEKVEGGITGIPSGFKRLDKLTSGWQPSDLIIIAARPAMGKTALALTVARNAAVEYKKPVGLFSLEMSSVQLVDRLISGETEIESEVIKKRALTELDWLKLHNNVIKLYEAPIYIDDTPALSIVQFRAKAKRLKQLYDVQMIIVDYLQLMRGEKEKGSNSNREQEISSISRGLKAVAKDLNIPVIALSQLSRALENRPGASKRPRLSDLRESGAIEQDADQVIFLYRPEYYGLTEDEEGRSTIGIAEAIIAKNRTGDTDTAVLRFISKYVRFADLEEDFGIDYVSNQFPFPANSNFVPVDRPSNFIIRPSRIDDLDEEPPF